MAAVTHWGSGISVSRRTVSRLSALLVLVTVWQIAVTRLGRDFMATPFGIADALPEVLLRDPRISPGAAETFGVFSRGMVLSIVAGTLLRLALGRMPALANALAPYVNAIRRAHV